MLLRGWAWRVSVKFTLFEKYCFAKIYLSDLYSFCVWYEFCLNVLRCKITHAAQSRGFAVCLGLRRKAAGLVLNFECYVNYSLANGLQCFIEFVAVVLRCGGFDGGGFAVFVLYGFHGCSPRHRSM